MPLQLLTGLPGNGKTLRLLSSVRKLQKETGRPVYYYDIRLKDHPEVRDWIPLGDPATFGRRKEQIEPDMSQVTRWHELVPSGSIMVIDECWAPFPKRGPSAPVPKHVSELATHRHRGIDVFLTSQHAANQIDHFVRGLVQTHEHVIRLFGSERARVHKWDQGLGDPSDYHSRQASVTELWKFPREVYDWYHSAEVHTIKRTIPCKPFLTIGGGVVAIAILGFLGWRTLAGNVGAVSEATGEAAEAMQPARVSGGHESDIWGAGQQPRVEGLAMSASMYDGLVEPRTVPRVAGCASLVYSDGRIDCWCNSQQGTRLAMSTRMCLRLLEEGVFDWTQTPEEERKHRERAWAMLPGPPPAYEEAPQAAVARSTPAEPAIEQPAT